MSKTQTIRDMVEEVIQDYASDHVFTEIWSDPGDYPSESGGGPLPSYPYLALDADTMEVPLGDEVPKDMIEELSEEGWTITVHKYDLSLDVEATLDQVITRGKNKIAVISLQETT